MRGEGILSSIAIRGGNVVHGERPTTSLRLFEVVAHEDNRLFFFFFFNFWFFGRFK